MVISVVNVSNITPLLKAISIATGVEIDVSKNTELCGILSKLTFLGREFFEKELDTLLKCIPDDDQKIHNLEQLIGALSLIPTLREIVASIPEFIKVLPDTNELNQFVHHVSAVLLSGDDIIAMADKLNQLPREDIIARLKGQPASAQLATLIEATGLTYIKPEPLLSLSETSVEALHTLTRTLT